MCIFACSKSSLQAQSTNSGIIFQALARDAFHNPAINRMIIVQTNIIQSSVSGLVVLAEEHSATTDPSGIFTIHIGLGTKMGGTKSDLESIDWDNGPYFLNMKIAIVTLTSSNDASAAKDWIDLGTTTFGVVPYALHVLSNNKIAPDTSSNIIFTSKLNISDTSTLLHPYARKFYLDSALSLKPNFSDLSSLLNINDTINLSNRIDTKLSIVDTANMLNARFARDTVFLSERINQKVDNVNVSNALSFKANIADVNTALDSKLDKVAGKALSTNDYTNAEKLKLATITGINTGDQDLSTFASIITLGLKLNSVDTGLMLSNRFSRDTMSLSNRVNLKLNSVDTSLMLSNRFNRDTVSLSNRIDFKLNSTDTSTMLSNRFNRDTTFLSDRINLKLNSTDTSSMLANRFARDTVSLSDRISLKANAVDMISSLSSKVDKETGKVLSSNDYTTNEKIKLLAISGTNTGDQDLSNYATITNLSSKVNISDTATMLNNRIGRDTIPLSNRVALKLNISDTTVMLNNRFSRDTISLDNRINLKLNSIDTSNMMSTRFARDTVSLSNRIDVKANVTNVDNALSLKANTLDVRSSLLLKEDNVNKSNDIDLGGIAANDILFPTQKAVKSYVDGQISSGGVHDGSILTRHIANSNITTALIADASITDAKMTMGISKLKVGLGSVENTAISTWIGSSNLNTLGTISAGVWSATAIAIANGGTGATTASDARANLELVIGTNVQAPLIPGTDYVVPNTSIIGASKTKITYDVNGLVLAGSDATTADIATSVNRNYVTDAQVGVLSNTSGINSGDETTSTIKTKLGITTLSGSNTGDQDLSTLATITNLNLKLSSADTSAMLSNRFSRDTTWLSNRINLKANNIDVTSGLLLKANASDVTSSLATKVDKVIGKDLSANDYTTAEKTKLSLISGTNTGDQDLSTLATITNLNLKLSSADTSAMLSNRFSRDTASLSNRINLKLSSVDTSSMLTNRFGRDTASLSNRINLKANLLAPTFVTPTLGDAVASGITVSGDVKSKRFVQTATAAITAATTTTIDFSLGNVFQINMGTNITTLTITNAVFGTYLLKFTQDATGSRNIVFPTVNWKWASGVIPDLTNAANKTDIVTLIYDGTTFYATIVQNF